MQFKSLFYVASLVCVAFSATTQDVLNDLATVKTAVTTLDNAIKLFQSNPTSLIDALAIHSDVAPVQSAVDKTTSDSNTLPVPVALADGNSILAAVNAIVPLIEDALTRIVAIKGNIQALPIGNLAGLVRSDLAVLNTSTTGLENSLVGHSPPQLLAQANTIVNELNSAFATAIAAYAT